jgi:hypothetical protein
MVGMLLKGNIQYHNNKTELPAEISLIRLAGWPGSILVSGGQG